jgi:hypothetical protein
MDYPVEEAFSKKVVAGPSQPFCCVELGTEYGRKTRDTPAFHYLEYLFLTDMCSLLSYRLYNVLFSLSALMPLRRASAMYIAGRTAAGALIVMDVLTGQAKCHPLMGRSTPDRSGGYFGRGADRPGKGAGCRSEGAAPQNE